MRQTWGQLAGATIGAKSFQEPWQESSGEDTVIPHDGAQLSRHVLEPNFTPQKRVHARARWWVLRHSCETAAVSRGTRRHTKTEKSAKAPVFVGQQRHWAAVSETNGSGKE